MAPEAQALSARLVAESGLLRRLSAQRLRGPLWSPQILVGSFPGCSGHPAAPRSGVTSSRRESTLAPGPLYRRRGGVVVAVLGSANCSACRGSIRPEPKLSSRALLPSRFALVVRIRRISAGVSFGLRSSTIATIPLTSAAAPHA